MPSFKSMLALSLLAMGSVVNAAAVPEPCVTIIPRTWLMESAAALNQLINVGSAIGEANVLTLASSLDPQQAPTAVWDITAADQGAYNFQNSQLGRNVSTLHLVESNLFLPVVEPVGTTAATYAIQCAGSNQYVIKSVDADQLFTVVNTTEGIATIELLPADGSIQQRWFFHPL